jgi:hypothetical protein
MTDSTIIVIQSEQWKVRPILRSYLISRYLNVSGKSFPDGNYGEIDANVLVIRKKD